MKILSVIITFLPLMLFAQGDPVQITPYQVLDARTGQAIACSNCSIYTYVAGTSTPLATYTDSTLTTANTNPVITNSSGYASNGSSITGIWVGSSCYKFQLKDQNGVTIWTQDNICDHAAVKQLSLYGLTTIQNNTPTSNGNYIDLTPITYNPYDGPPCVDIYGNAVQQPLPATGSPTFGNNDLILWNATSASMPPNGSCGLSLPVNQLNGVMTNGYFFGRAGFGTDYPYFNSIQSLGGGVSANSFTAGTIYPAGTVTSTGVLSVATYLGGHTDTGHSVGPPASGTIATVTNPFSTAEGLVAGMIYYDDGANCEEVYSGTAWACIGGGGGGGSPGGATTNVQFNNAGSFGGSANYIWNNTSHLLTVTGIINTASIDSITGFIQSDGGFVVSSNTAYNSIHTMATGGMAGRSFTATKYVQTGNNSGVPTVTTSDSFNAGSMYYDTGNACEEVYSGSTWSCLSGGSGTPGGATTNVQINSSGSFGGSGNLTFSSNTLTDTATNSSSAAIYGKTGFIQSDIGFVALAATATLFNSFQAPAGGMSALSFTAGHYVQSGSSAGVPTVTGSDTFNAGALYYDTVATCEELYNGSTWSCLGSGGGGSPGGATTNVQFNNAGSFGGSGNFTWNNTNATITVARIGGGSGVVAPLFNANIAGATGGAKTFQNSDGSFTIDYQGNFATQNIAMGGSFSGTHAQNVGSGDNVTFNIVSASSGLLVSANGANITGGLLVSTNSALSTANQILNSGSGQALNVAASSNVFSATFSDSGGTCRIGFASGGVTCPSDERLKHNIQDLPNELEKVLQLRPVSFNWNNNNQPYDGLIAQEVQKIYPLTVHEGDDGYLNLSYQQLMPYLIKSIQELQSEIDQLKASSLTVKTLVGLQ